MANYTVGLITKNKIINSAKDLIYKKGIKETTIKEICEHAEIAQPLFFHYFKNKQELALIIFGWLNNLLTDKVNSLLNKKFQEKKSFTFKMLLYNSFIYKFSSADPNVKRFYYEIFEINPGIVISERNRSSNEFFIKKISSSCDEKTIERFNISMASWVCASYFWNISPQKTMTEDEFLHFLLRFPLTAFDNKPVDENLIDNVISEIDKHYIDVGEIFLMKYE